MRTLILSFCIFTILSIYSYAQNWFPLEVGNKSMSRYSYNYMGSQCDYYFIEVTADSTFDANKYYFVKSYSDRDGLYESFWLRYDHNNQTIFQHGNDTTVIFMDFNLPNGSSFVYFNPITGVSANRTVFESTATHFGMTRNTKGFVDDGFWARMKEWVDTVGVKPFGPLIQVLQLNNQDTTYFEYNYGPDFSYFQPSLKTNEFNFVDTLFVWHHYTNNSGPGYKDFIDYLCLDTYYKSSSDSILGTKIYSTSFLPWGQRVVFNLDQNLIKQGYEFYYIVTAKDKGLIPKYRTSPTTGYYKLIYDPSPAQVLFSQDSIYIPTLSDSGSVQIINTSDYLVKIDSIISVGSFYGYRGFFRKPGFEYPFYLFQTLPSPQWSDTLGIIIPPHDSINVSFYEVDLCPVCDYEVQEYFKDTLRFVFTFIDGNVYSFSNSIPISGEGHPSDLDEDEILPNEFVLHQNYPNPFNPSTSIQYAISSRQFVSLKIYDVLGNEISTLVNEYRDAGNYEAEFNASKLSSGVYYYQLKTGDFIQTKKMIYLK